MTASIAELERRLAHAEHVNRTVISNLADLRRRAEKAEMSRDFWMSTWEEAIGDLAEMVDGEGPVDRSALRALLDRWEREAEG